MRPQIEDRLVEFGIEHLGESLDAFYPASPASRQLQRFET